LGDFVQFFGKFMLGMGAKDVGEGGCGHFVSCFCSIWGVMRDA
jgi:hypothetical protein